MKTIIIFLEILISASLWAQSPEFPDPSLLDTSLVEQNQSTLIDTTIIIPKLEFLNISLYDALSALSRAYSLSLYIDSSVVGNIRIRLDDVSVNDAILFIIKEYDLAWEKTGKIIKIYKPAPPPKLPEPIQIEYSNGLITFDLKNVDINRLVNELITITGKNIIIEDNLRGTVTAKVTQLELSKAMQAIFPANGYSYRVVDEIAYVSAGEATDKNNKRIRNLNISCDEGLISVDVMNNSLEDVLNALATTCNLNLFIQTKPEGNITASFTDKSAEEALTFLLLNSEYTYKRIENIYFIGNKASEDLYDSKLIRLKHQIAQNIAESIPTSLGKLLTVKVIKEHNGLILTGPKTSIAKLESFISEIDIPMAQVLFEVLVVDYSLTDKSEFGITANNTGEVEGHSYYPMIDLSARGSDLNNNLRSIERNWGISNLGTLDDDFYIRLNMMEQENKANVRSHPQIASLNGHPASIKIGSTQYYLLSTETSYVNQANNDAYQTAERFEVIEADMSVDVTPYLNIEGELIVEVKAEFNNPTTKFDPDIPPNISKRTLSSTVKLRHGETIVLGGLITNTKEEQIDKLPLLGSIPILGRIFQNRYSTEEKSELMIYITPFVYYGNEQNVDIDSLIQTFK